MQDRFRLPCGGEDGFALARVLHLKFCRAAAIIPYQGDGRPAGERVSQRPREHGRVGGVCLGRDDGDHEVFRAAPVIGEVGVRGVEGFGAATEEEFPVEGNPRGAARQDRGYRATRGNRGSIGGERKGAEACHRGGDQMHAGVQCHTCTCIVGFGEEGDLVGDRGAGRRGRGAGGVFEDVGEAEEVGEVAVLVFDVEGEADGAVGNVRGAPVPGVGDGVGEGEGGEEGADLHPGVVDVGLKIGGIYATAFVQRPAGEGDGGLGEGLAEGGGGEIAGGGGKVGDDGVLGGVVPASGAGRGGAGGVAGLGGGAGTSAVDVYVVEGDVEGGAPVVVGVGVDLKVEVVSGGAAGVVCVAD